MSENYVCPQCGPDPNGPEEHQRTHHLFPECEGCKTLKSQNERLVKLLDRCVHAVEQEYGIDNWRVEEAKALLAEIKL